MKHCHPFTTVLTILFSVAFPVSGHLMAQFITIDTTFYSPSLKETRNVTVFLPQDYYKDQDVHYSTVYYLHGWGGNHESLNSSLERLNDLLESGTINPLIIVCADHSALPFGSGVYVNSVLTGDFEDYAAFDVVDWVETSFRAVPEKNARALFGQSLGAYGAFWLGIQHKDRFRALSAHAGHVNNNVWMPAVRLMLMLENGTPPYFYDFFGFNSENPAVIPGFFTKSMFLAASGFSPDENSSQTYINPRIVDYPFDEWGNILDSVYNKWKTYDIAQCISTLTPSDSVAILFGCGTNDETMAYFPNLALRDSLELHELNYEFLSHKGSHTMPDVYFNRSMIFLDSLLMPPLIITRAGAGPTSGGLFAFPNPAKDHSVIRLIPGETQTSVSVMDCTGHLLSSCLTAAETRNGCIRVDLSWLAGGIYFLRFSSNLRSGLLKIVKTD